MKYFIFTLFLVFSVGCKSVVEIKSSRQNSVPSWILVPPNDSQIRFYGVGSGNSRKSAINSALADITTKISVTVSAEFNSKLSINKRESEIVKTDSNKSINAKSIPIKIRQYTVDKIYAPLPTKIQVLVSIDIRLLINDYRAILDGDLNEHNLKKSQLKSNSKFSQYQFFKRAEQSLVEFKQNSSILKILNPTEDMTKYIKHEQSISNNLQLVRSQLKFNVTGDDKSDKFVKEMNNILAKQQISANGKTPFSIKISTNKTVGKYRSFIIHKYLITLAILEKNEAINSKQITIKVVDKTPANETPHKAITKFSEKLPPILSW